MTQIAPGPVRQKRPKMLRSEAHRRFVAEHWCASCNEGHRIRNSTGVANSQCTHVSYLGREHGRPRGKGEKVDDYWTVPLCWRCHHDQGHWPDGEEAWWEHIGLDPEPICLELARNSPDPAVREAVKDL